MCSKFRPEQSDISHLAGAIQKGPRLYLDKGLPLLDEKLASEAILWVVFVWNVLLPVLKPERSKQKRAVSLAAAGVKKPQPVKQASAERELFTEGKAGMTGKEFPW